jgi:hypothetical protein
VLINTSIPAKLLPPAPLAGSNVKRVPSLIV